MGETCEYYLFKENDYYCVYREKYLDSDTVKKYCWGYNHDDCEYYKQSPAYSSGSCFLTSACVKAKGLSDDCEELTILRSYRDTYVKGIDKGSTLILEYYQYAPSIVEKINENTDHLSIWLNLYERLILPCVMYIKEQRYNEALDLYKQAFLELKEKYCI